MMGQIVRDDFVAKPLDSSAQNNASLFAAGRILDEEDKSVLRKSIMSCFRCCLVLLLMGCCFLGRGSVLSAQTSKATGKPKGNPKARNHTSILPAGVQEYSSKNFLVRTDLSKNDAEDLLKRLENMLVLVSRYFGKPNSQMIEMNVVQDLKLWPPESIHEQAMDSLRNDAGITLSVTAMQQNELGQKQITGAKSIVWSVSTGGIAQHEAVHAYCHQNFGRTGPTWYAEGMAEMGQYWRDKDKSVRIPDAVLAYLKESKPKTLVEITAPGQRTGDSWQNYAWRWALCHLLSTNPNYEQRFKPLGMALLNDQRTSFEEVYGSMAKEISFEYQFFLEHMGQGFRSDLCGWDWKTKFQRLRGSGTAQAKIDASRGWQASRVLLKSGDKISYTTSGEWVVQREGPKGGPDGDEKGHGKLVGILFADYELSEPFDLGSGGEYEASRSGQLFLRCQDDWCETADNTGAVTVKFKAAN